jgi:hypothetical protein
LKTRLQDDENTTCAGYLREPHNATPVLYLVSPNGTKKGLCQVCATRWLLSDEGFPNNTQPKLFEIRSPLGTKSYTTQEKEG